MLKTFFIKKNFYYIILTNTEFTNFYFYKGKIVPTKNNYKTVNGRVKKAEIISVWVSYKSNFNMNSKINNCKLFYLTLSGTDTHIWVFKKRAKNKKGVFKNYKLSY